MKLEKLALARTYQPAVRSAKVGRVWIKVASGRRRAVAERIAQFARIDDRNALVQVRCHSCAVIRLAGIRLRRKQRQPFRR